MTSEEQPTPTAAAAARAGAPDLPEVAPAGTPGERARAMLRLRPYRRLWVTQLIGGTADRLAFLVLLLLTVFSAAAAGQFGGGYRGVALAVALVFAVRLAATLLFGAALLGPLYALLSNRLDRRWTLIGADGLRAVLVGISPWWFDWVSGSAATWTLLATVFTAGAAERVWAVAKDATTPSLLPPSDPYAPQAEQRPSAANLETVRTLDLRTGWATVPLAAVGLIAFTLLNNLFAALGSQWLRDHQVTMAALGAAGLLAASGVLLYLQELPRGKVTSGPRSPLQGLRAPTDATPGPALSKGRTGSAPYFTFSVAAAYAAMAGTAALALLTAAEHGAGPIGYGLLVLAATGAPWLGLRLTKVTLPALSRRRLLAVSLLAMGTTLILAGLVFDYVLILLLTTLAGTAAGIVIGVGRALLEQEVEEARLARVTDHLYAVLRAVVAAALIAVPLIAAAYGQVDYGTRAPGDFTFVHAGAALAVATAGVLTLVLAAVVLLKTDDQRGTVPFGRELLEALGAGRSDAPHRTTGSGFFIALEGGDGAGKSTQAQALAEWIRSKGHEVVLTREPGGSPVGQRLRGLVLDVGNTGLSHRAEALIYAADRAEHVENVIRPALARGAVVITDRYMDSSIAYQGAGRDLAATEVARISRWATGGLVPDLTVVLDVDPTKARERFTEALDRLESEPTEFHARVRAGFLALAAADPVRYLVVDGSQAPAFVTTAVRHRLDRELPLSEQEKTARIEQERRAKEEADRRAAEEARVLAEAEAAERKRLELLEELRAEQAEKDRLAKEEAERVAAEAARQAAEEVRLKAEEAAKLRAAQEAERQAAEQVRLKAEAAEQERIAAEAAQQAELQRRRDVQREEQRRRAEEALQRAEETRLAEAAAAAAAAASATVTAELPQVGPDDLTQEISERDRRAAVAAADAVARGKRAPAAAADETAVLPTVPAADATAVLPRIGSVDGGKAAPGGTVPPVLPVEERVPPGLWRPEPAAERPVEQTREFPPVPAEDAAPPLRPARPSWAAPTEASDTSEAADVSDAADASTEEPERPARPAWAEETPMDDLPSLTDTLLGSREDWARWQQAEPEGEHPEDGTDGKGRKRRK
ncbi:dTMP kinase [Kitasatospora sp. MAA4]|uniref:dTMP kinase n=1 Tax=Kitasatospora sp. MAA4 TaxID=3035093 RepID=UPI002474080C|nr:dTMP kinase [Kitasatospora sp. MAA4]MDH6137042.1 dTMP kinase [Kitasatospora sp. MAA4]